MIGFGGVAGCTLPLLLRHLEISPSRILVIDFLDKTEVLHPWIEQGLTFIQKQITRENLNAVLQTYVSTGDLLVDLSTYINSMEVLNWCHDQGVMYINTSLEIWDLDELSNKSFTELTLYARHMELRKNEKLWFDTKGSTAVLDHGANPGLVSHFAKIGLEDIAEKILRTKPQDPRRKLLEKFLNEDNFPGLAEITGTKVIHISERDTQVIHSPKKPNEFVNTWSVEGLAEEAIAPAELGWGTHEKNLPKNAASHIHGPQNQICLTQMGLDTWVRSWVPSGEIIGMVIRHGEAFSLSDYLTVWDNYKARYRPSVYYAYCPADYAINSVHEYKMRRFNLQPTQRLVKEEIIEGYDELGILLMGHDFNSWWVGSILDIHQARKLLPGENATLVQVAISVVSAILWMIKNPNRGVNLPESLPHKEIMKTAKPYLGKFVSRSVNWTPLTYKNPKYTDFAEPERNNENLWEFRNFLA